MPKRLYDLLFLLAVAAVIGLMARPATNPESRLYGAWTFQDDAKRVVITFNPDHTLVARLGDGENEHATYRTDFTTTPAQMDVQRTGQGDTVKTIFELMPDGRLRLMDNNAGRPRPESFGERTLVLTRQAD